MDAQVLDPEFDDVDDVTLGLIGSYRKLAKRIRSEESDDDDDGGRPEAWGKPII